MNALVAGNGSYIVRPCGHDLHGPTLGNTGTLGNYQSNDWSSAFANTDLMLSNVAWGIGKHLH